MLDYLPDEVISEILFRLPVKSLIRFRCVSKAWCSLISSPHFIVTHLQVPFQNPPFLLFSHYDLKVRKQHFTLHSSVGPFSRQEELEEKGGFFASDFIELSCPWTRGNINHCWYIVGSSNGLLCLAVDYNDGYVLWNPSIRKYIRLPYPRIGYPLSSIHHSLPRHRPFWQRLGFGYHSATDDYKLVRVVYLLSPTPYSFSFVRPQLEIYTLRTRAWRSVTNPGPRYDISMFSSSVFLNGAVHWLTHTSFHFLNVIVAFNLGDETFGEIAVPMSLKEVFFWKLAVAVFEGCLALVPLNQSRSDDYHPVWVMKVYGVAESWTKVFDIDVGQGLERVIGFTKNGEVLVIKDGRVFSYEPSRRRTLDGHIFGERNSFYLDTYVESLVLLNVTDEVLGRQASSSGGSKPTKNVGST